MENIITRTDFQTACQCVDAVSGTVTIKRCVEGDTARQFPHDEYLEYLDWLADYVRNDFPLEEETALTRFERGVNETFALLESDGTLYLEDYRCFISDIKQITFALNRLFGKSWLFENHVKEAIKRKRQRHHE